MGLLDFISKSKPSSGQTSSNPTPQNQNFSNVTYPLPNSQTSTDPSQIGAYTFDPGSYSAQPIPTQGSQGDDQSLPQDQSQNASQDDTLTPPEQNPNYLADFNQYQTYSSGFNYAPQAYSQDFNAQGNLPIYDQIYSYPEPQNTNSQQDTQSTDPSVSTPVQQTDQMQTAPENTFDSSFQPNTDQLASNDLQTPFGDSQTQAQSSVGSVSNDLTDQTQTPIQDNLDITATNNQPLPTETQPANPTQAESKDTSVSESIPSIDNLEKKDETEVQEAEVTLSAQPNTSQQQTPTELEATQPVQIEQPSVGISNLTDSQAEPLPPIVDLQSKTESDAESTKTSTGAAEVKIDGDKTIIPEIPDTPVAIEELTENQPAPEAVDISKSEVVIGTDTNNSSKVESSEANAEQSTENQNQEATQIENTSADTGTEAVNQTQEAENTDTAEINNQDQIQDNQNDVEINMPTVGVPDISASEQESTPSEVEKTSEEKKEDKESDMTVSAIETDIVNTGSFNIFQSIAFVGLNSKTFANVSSEVKKLTKELSQKGINIIIDSNKGYGIDVVGGLENVENARVTAVFFKPFYSNYSDEAEIKTNVDEYVTVFYSDFIERLKYFIKEANAFVIPETTGLINLSMLTTLLSLQYLYHGHHKPVVLIGAKWKGKIDQLKSIGGINEEQMKSINIAANSKEALETLLRLDSELSTKKETKSKRVYDYRDGDEEHEYMI